MPDSFEGVGEPTCLLIVSRWLNKGIDAIFAAVKFINRNACGVNFIRQQGGYMRIRALALGITLVSSVASTQVLAGQGVPIGPGARFESSVQAHFLSTDNYYRTNGNEVDATAFVLLPTLGISYAPTDGLFNLLYSGELGEVDTASQDDYLDHRLAFTGSMRPYVKHAFDFGAAYIKGHDDIGTVRTGGQRRVDDRDMDEWNSATGSIKYTYGAPTAKLNWFIFGNLFDREYTTNEFDPINPATGTRFLSRSQNGVGTGLTYKLTPKSKLMFNVEHVEIDYDTDLDPSLDGTLDRALLGLRWLAAAKTHGELWIGAFSRDFDDSRRKEGTGGSWLAKVTWSPRTYSNISLSTGQEVEEAVLRGENFVDRRHLGLRWDYDWNVRFSTFVSGRYTRDIYEGSDREDDLNEFSIGGRFELSKYYSVGLIARSVEGDSNANFFDYDRRNLLLTLNAAY